MAGAPRPIVIIDTSVFVKDALSKNRAGAASQILALAPAIAHIVTCDDIVEETLEKIVQHAGWSRAQVLEVYGAVLAAAVVVTPVPEREDHRRFVNDDADDTMFVRVAEAIYEQAEGLIAADQLRIIVSENTHHLRPGSGYAGFLCRTAAGAVRALTED